MMYKLLIHLFYHPPRRRTRCHSKEDIHEMGQQTSEEGKMQIIEFLRFVIIAKLSICGCVNGMNAKVCRHTHLWCANCVNITGIFAQQEREVGGTGRWKCSNRLQWAIKIMQTQQKWFIDWSFAQHFVLSKIRVISIIRRATKRPCQG